ncbi:MAG: hypothetical protein US95_C0020G0008 [Candidatus Woesebacteria bacterium GW2011_GWB1_38_5]|uniref:SGNH hydrolase-type esterase domain-containing protein n=4 Tax=Candidatus Woeseibacteriota TaxID=1752722 RepID=A0A0G0NC89_9BACT|nr:MAG: hypothetical protein US67_C0027G0008 [Candidatus Woesebacteria bacterium GW2011_GWD1_38_10]KKQ53949.1 MAG: hypothetical protein US75_C0046G0006 [Candidatus Woesebacteria bacterium GW2011_GWC1_38_13]KKQ74706.1 MAG: hypothetical protein US95_C0020G0008 [Candidatus Woesebacteria bacterium GW2011_GWB1_38_5]KKQ84485.1 MAG: hypothetical protein UT06_C0004G0021 [Candidatus Woesebacteria bacterium GW2011_GWA1_38_8]
MNRSAKEINLQFLSLTVLFIILIFFLPIVKKSQKLEQTQGNITSKFSTPTPFNPFPYVLPKIPYARSYLTLLVGDSIVGSLGPNADTLRQNLIDLYPDHEFVNYNYGFGSTNITSLPERLTGNTSYRGQEFPAILSQAVDLIIIESFAYNPLSEKPENENVSKHIQILDESVKKIIQTRPKTAVALMTPIAPNTIFFAKGVYDLSGEERALWAKERIMYIEAVVEYANKNNIPLINVYEKSLTPTGDGDLKYINPDDYIHPSHNGVILMSKTIADFIFTNNIFPE